MHDVYRHEIAGTAVRVGSQVEGIKVGDRVGLGAQIASCYDCHLCTHDNENYCPKRIDTYGDKYPDGVVRPFSQIGSILSHWVIFLAHLGRLFDRDNRRLAIYFPDSRRPEFFACVLDVLCWTYCLLTPRPERSRAGEESRCHWDWRSRVSIPNYWVILHSNNYSSSGSLRRSFCKGSGM